MKIIQNNIMISGLIWFLMTIYPPQSSNIILYADEKSELAILLNKRHFSQLYNPTYQFTLTG